MAESISIGDAYELRLARLLFTEGAFVRRAVNLNMHFGEAFTVTDIDVLALHFSSSLVLTTTVGECKTTDAKSAPKATDRLLWGGGLRTLVGADRNFVATTRPASDRVRRLAEQLGATLLDERDVAHREQIWGLDKTSAWGPFDPRLLLLQRRAFKSIKEDTDLRRVYWFVRSDFWFIGAVAGLKRALGACRLLATRWDPSLPDMEKEAVKWLAHEAMICATVALVRIAAGSYQQPAASARQRLVEQLAEGLADYRTLTEISREVDRYVMAVLRDAGADPARQTQALGALTPSPPSYTEPLIEVVERLAAEPRIASQLPRVADWQNAEAQLSTDLPPVLSSEDGVAAKRLLRTIGAFLQGQIKVPPSLMHGLLLPVPEPANEATQPRNGAEPNGLDGVAARPALRGETPSLPPPELFPDAHDGG